MTRVITTQDFNHTGQTIAFKDNKGNFYKSILLSTGIIATVQVPKPRQIRAAFLKANQDKNKYRYQLLSDCTLFDSVPKPVPEIERLPFSDYMRLIICLKK